MGYKTTIQIVLIVISIVIIMTYIKPTLAEVRVIQDETEQYKVAVEKSSQFLSLLQQLRGTAESFSVSEMRALEQYVPNDIDAVAVLRDIEIVVENNNMQLGTLSFEEPIVPLAEPIVNVQGGEAEASLGTTVQLFNLSVTGTYDQFKNLLRDFERNAYPLEVNRLTFTPSDSSFFTFFIVLESYAFNGGTE